MEDAAGEQNSQRWSAIKLAAGKAAYIAFSDVGSVVVCPLSIRGMQMELWESGICRGNQSQRWKESTCIFSWSKWREARWRRCNLC